MEESKTLVEQLREMVELSIKSNQDPTVHADAIIGHLCVSMSDARELFTIIANRIEREYMPLPLLEGEPLKVGDRVDGYFQEGAEVVAVMNSDMVVVRSTVKGGYGYHDEAYPLMLWCVDSLKRHRQEVLDADGNTVERNEKTVLRCGVLRRQRRSILRAWGRKRRRRARTYRPEGRNINRCVGIPWRTDPQAARHPG